MKKNIIRGILSLSLIILLVAGCTYEASAGALENKDDWASVNGEELGFIQDETSKDSGEGTEEKTKPETTTPEPEKEEEIKTVDPTDDKSSSGSSETDESNNSSEKEKTEEEKLKEKEEAEKKKKEDEEKEKNKEKPAGAPYGTEIDLINSAERTPEADTYTVKNSDDSEQTLTLSAGEYTLSFTASNANITVNASAATTIILSGNSSVPTVTINGLTDKNLELNGGSYAFGAAMRVNLTTSNPTLTIPSDPTTGLNNPNITLKGALTLTGTTTGTITLGGNKLTLVNADTFVTTGDGEVITASGSSTITTAGAVTVDGTAGTLTLESGSTGTATIKGSAVDIGTSAVNIVATGALSVTGTTTGNINIGAHTVTLNTPGTPTDFHKITGIGTAFLSAATGDYTIKPDDSVTIDAGTNAGKTTLDLIGIAAGKTIILKGGVAASSNVDITASAPTPATTPIPVVDISAYKGKINSTPALKNVTIKSGNPILVTPDSSGNIDINVSGDNVTVTATADVTGTFKVSSDDTTNLTITSTGTITGTVNTTGMPMLASAKLSNLTGNIIFNAPGSTDNRGSGTASLFTSLDISNASDNTDLTSFTMTVNGDSTATVSNDNENVIPNFNKLNVAKNTGLLNINLAGLGIEAPDFKIEGWINTATPKILDLSGNGLSGDIYTWLKPITNLETLIIQNNPNEYTKWVVSDPQLSKQTMTINVAEFDNTTPFKTIDLSGSSLVEAINFTNEDNIASPFDLTSHGSLVVGISEHNKGAKKFIINGDIGTLNLTDDNLTKWDGTGIIGSATNSNWLTLGGNVQSTLNIDNNDLITLTGNEIDFSGFTYASASTICFKSSIDSSIPTAEISEKVATLTIDDDAGKLGGSSKIETLTISGVAGSALANVTVANHNDTGTNIAMKELIYDTIGFTTKALPDVINWGGTITDKTLKLVGDNGIVDAGKFYGDDEDSGTYLTKRGYHKLNIIDFGLNKLQHLNLSDQNDGTNGTIHTLKLVKTALVTYNLKGNNKIVNGTNAGKALEEVFNITPVLPTTKGELTHVDYSGCTQLKVGEIGNTATTPLDISKNVLVVAYLGGIPDIIDVQAYDNSLSRADAVTALPNSNALSDTTGNLGLYLGAETGGSKFHATESVINISDNPLDIIDFGNKNGTRVLGLTYVLAAHTNNTIGEGVFVSDEPNLAQINLAGQTVGTKGDGTTGLYLNNNINLTHLWGSTNVQGGSYPTGKMDVKIVPAPNNNTGLAVKENLDLSGSDKIFGTAGGSTRLEFNHVVGVNEHEIRNANLKATTAENIQINDNIILSKVDISEPKMIIKNLELANNSLTTMRNYDAPGGSSIVLPADKTKLTGVIILDQNPISQILVNKYNEIEFVSMNNTGLELRQLEGVLAVKPDHGRFAHKIAMGEYAIDLSDNALLVGIDITGNEVHGLNLSKNPELHSILGTLNVNGASPTRIADITKTLGAFTGVKDKSLVVGKLNLSEIVEMNEKVIFAGHYINKADLSKSKFSHIDLRRNDGKGENATMIGSLASPVYLDVIINGNFSHQGILEQVDISEMEKAIDKLYLDENKLTKIDSTATAPAGSKVFMAKTKFTPKSVMTLNKNDLTDVTIVPGNGTNLEVLRELQLNDNMLKNLNFSKMTGLTTLRVNRTVKDRNNFTKGTVNLSGATSLKEFAPSTIVGADKETNDKITRIRPSRPNESYWNVKTAVNDNGSAYNLDWTPQQSFENIIEPTTIPSYLSPFTPSEATAGFYHYVELQGLNIEGCTALVTLRVPGNHLTTGKTHLTNTPNIKFLDISGKHALSSKDGEYVIPNGSVVEIQSDYFYRDNIYNTPASSSTYKDGASGKLSGAFVSIWPKAENIYIQNNSYTSFDVAQSAGSVKNILAFNNAMNSVEVSKASSLQVLDVERNNIRPTIVLPTQSLIIFRAGHNQISKYPNTQSVPGLQEIYLNHNNFPSDSIPNAINTNPKLKVFNVAVNNFKFLPTLETNPALEEVYAFDNNLLNLPRLSASGNLKVLDLHRNLIASITQQLPNSIRYLDLSDNKFIDFAIPNIPTSMSDKNGAVTAHERKPSHYFDGLTGQTVNGKGYSGTLNIRHNQIPEITKQFHDAWVSFKAGSPTKINDFYLEYNLLDVDIYDKNAALYGGTQKWLRSIDDDYVFLIDAPHEIRKAMVVPNLRFWHPLRQTYELAPRTHNYDIWFNVEDNREIMGFDTTIYQTIDRVTMYARVVSARELASIRHKNPDIINRTAYDSSKSLKINKDIYVAGVESRRLTPRNDIAVMLARLVGPDTVWEPWESSNVTGKSKTDQKGKVSGKYNPTTGPK